MMRVVPGLHITQHTGGAKAHQIFLRGFDAEHGQDVAGYLDGIPLNEVSHVHGQGYLDLHFLVPSTIKTIKLIKGPYDRKYSNFATAGAVDFIPYERREKKYHGYVEGGSFATIRGLGQTYQKLGSTDGIYALYAETTRGYTDPGKLQAIRGFTSHVVPLTKQDELKVLYTGYVIDSTAADTIPLLPVQQGRLDRFGNIDNSSLVDVTRQIVGLEWRHEEKDSRFNLKTY